MAGKPRKRRQELLQRLEQLIRELPSQREGGGQQHQEGEALFPEVCTFAEFRDRYSRIIADRASWLRDEEGSEGTAALFTALMEQLALCLYLIGYEAADLIESIRNEALDEDP